jgi:hypothetical protein
MAGNHLPEEVHIAVNLLNELIGGTELYSKTQSNVSFLGRLGTYRYLDMDVTIAEALAASQKTLKLITDKEAIPAFFVDPT